MKKFFAHHTENGLGFFQRGCVTADHEDELAFFGAPVAAGDGRIEETRAAFGAGSGNLAREGRRNGAGVGVD